MKLLQQIRCPAAFTLIELIVVIAIIAVLAGMLLPPIHHRQRRPISKTAQCMRNLKEIGVYMSMYAYDHSGLLPWQQLQNPLNTNSAHISSSPNLPAWQYAAKISEFARGSNWSGISWEFRCPLDAKRVVAEDNKGLMGNEGLSYFIGLNESREQSEVVTMGDRNLSPNKGQPLYSSADGKPVNVDTNTTVWGSARGNQFHENAGVLLFADGHVEYANALTVILASAAKTGGTNANRFLFPQ